MTDGSPRPVLASSGPGVSDRDTLRALYEAHAMVVRRLLLQLGVREADVDDLLQDVFLVALRRQAEFEGRSTARTWLCGIAVKLAESQRRRQRVRDLFRRRSHDEAASIQMTSPLRAVEQAQAKQLVQKILEHLPPKKRAVLVLYEVEQLSGEEIAEILGCPIKTVWTRLFYARQALSNELRKQGLLEVESVNVGKENRP